MTLDSTRRFSSRVENYRKYRPGYPPEVLEILRAECDLTTDSVVADIGSGTGIFTADLLMNGNRVFGVEPNAAMRAAAEQALTGYARFTSIDGASEATTLAAASVDFVTAAQAFHWFDREKARAEFARILKPAGWVVLLWNNRQLDSTQFLRSYEQLLRTHGTDYLQVRHADLDLAQVQSFVRPNSVKFFQLKHRQIFDFEGLRGRLLSSSYAPEVGHPDHWPMLDELSQIFGAYQEGGFVSFDYDTHLYCAQLGEG